MAINAYGTVRPATVTANDIDMFMQYQVDENTLPETLVKLAPNDILMKVDSPDNVNEMMGGLYNLNLNSTLFNRGLGIYTIYIRNRVITGNGLRIRDCGILDDAANIEGLIFDLNEMDQDTRQLFSNENGLVGYKMEYYVINQNAGEKLIPKVFNIITSNHRVEPISSSLANNQDGIGIRYRLNKNASLVFVTLTPSGSDNIDPTFNVFKGLPLQLVRISSTCIRPKCIKIKLTDIDLGTIENILVGNQTVDCESGIRTIFDDDGNITYQHDEFTEKNSVNEDIKKIKKKRDEIDFSQRIE